MSNYSYIQILHLQWQWLKCKMEINAERKGRGGLMRERERERERGVGGGSRDIWCHCCSMEWFFINYIALLSGLQHCPNNEMLMNWPLFHEFNQLQIYSRLLSLFLVYLFFPPLLGLTHWHSRQPPGFYMTALFIHRPPSWKGLKATANSCPMKGSITHYGR